MSQDAFDAKAYIAELVARSRGAQKQIEHYSQEQVDALIRAMVWSVAKPGMAEEIAQFTIDETQLGNYDGKFLKIQRKTRATLLDIIHDKSVGVIEEYPERNIRVLAKPLGVIGAIGAWNYPIQIACWKSAPALAAGNAMVFKPSEVTPLSALKLAEIFTEAGLPDGVFNVVQGDARVGVMLTEHPDIAKISFTGEAGTGKKVMSASASSSLKEVTMELGGKSPLLVFADSDLDRAADGAMMANFYSSGQVCTNGTRVFVEASVKDAFEAKIVERVARIKAGDPQDRATTFGPLVSFEHLDKVVSYLEIAKQDGARLLVGGERMSEGDFAKGAWVAPTVYTDCSDDMRIVQEEIFGPVMSILSFDSEEEVIRRANDTTYGLAAGLFTESLNRAHRVIHQLEAGICWVNTWGESPSEMPVGGYKQSGIGRENGVETLSHYTQTKSVLIEMGPFESAF